MLCTRRKKRKPTVKEEERQGKYERSGTQKEVSYAPYKANEKKKDPNKKKYQ